MPDGKLFEALKLGKKIPQTELFLFKGRYPSASPSVLKLTVADLSFSLDRGEIIAVRGPSGCGYVLRLFIS